MYKRQRGGKPRDRQRLWCESQEPGELGQRKGGSICPHERLPLPSGIPMLVFWISLRRPPVPRSWVLPCLLEERVDRLHLRTTGEVPPVQGPFPFVDRAFCRASQAIHQLSLPRSISCEFHPFISGKPRCLTHIDIPGPSEGVSESLVPVESPDGVKGQWIWARRAWRSPRERGIGASMPLMPTAWHKPSDELEGRPRIVRAVLLIYHSVLTSDISDCVDGCTSAMWSWTATLF